MHLNFHLRSRVVVHFLGLNLTFIYRSQYRVDEGGGGFAKRNFLDNQRLVVQFLNLGPHFQRSAPLSVVVFLHVNAATCGKVGIQLELFTSEIMYRRLANLIQVVWQNLRTQSYGNAFRTLRQQQRKLCRQCDWLLVAPVIAQLPMGGFGIEHHVECEFRQSCFDVSGCSGAVARENVSPVTLRVYQEVFLSHLYQGVSDGRIAVGMKLHGVSNDVGHLVVSPIVHALHRVQNASLNRFQAIFDVWNGAL